MNDIVVIHVTNPQGQILLGQRRDTNKWSSIVGHIRDGETPRQGAMRELREEVRIYADDSLTEVVTEQINGNSVHLFSFVYKDKQISFVGDPDLEFKRLMWWYFVPDWLVLNVPKSQNILYRAKVLQ